MELLTTREIVSITYLIIFLIWAFIEKNLRKHAFKILKIVCNYRFVFAFTFLIIYSLLLVHYLSLSPYWNSKYLKDIFFWILIVGIPLFFNSVGNKIEDNYFKKIIFKNFGLLAIVEYFTGTFTFNIFVEFLMQPLLLFFILLKTFSEMKDKYKQVETIVSWIISLTGFIILGFTIKVAVTNYKEMNSIDLIISFILPILLSTLYLPITYLFALYAKYSHLFKLLKYRKSLKKQDKENYRIKLVQKGKFSYDKVRRLLNILNNRSNLNLEEKEFSQLIDRFK